MTRRDPIYSVGQFPPDRNREDGPLPFMFNVTGPLGRLQGDLHWRISDFCRIHQITYKEILEVDQGLDKLELDIMQFSGDIDSVEGLKMIRLREAVREREIENRRVIIFVDHITIVGLWAIAEQFLGKIYRETYSIRNGVNPDDVSVPYRWDDFVLKYKNLEIVLSDCENFDNANECRVVNNTIKHDPKVGGKLLNFTYFNSFAGKDLESVPLEMQRYLNGVSNFIGSLIEKANKLLST